MKNPKIIHAAFFAAFCFYVSGPLSGESLETFLDASLAAALRNGGKPSEVQFGNMTPKLAPKHEGLNRLIVEIQNALDPSIMAETIQVYAKPQGAGTWSAEEQQAIFNSVIALSSLKGLQYYSSSRKAMRTFYEISSVIDGPETKNEIADPVYAYLPAGLTLYARQEDLTFGDNTYRYDYKTFNDSVIFVQENLTTMTAGIIPAVRKNRLRSVMAVIDAEDCLIVYAVSMAKAAAVPGLRNRIGNSFSNRAGAILTWFEMQANKVYGVD